MILRTTRKPFHKERSHTRASNVSWMPETHPQVGALLRSLRSPLFHAGSRAMSNLCLLPFRPFVFHPSRTRLKRQSNTSLTIYPLAKK